MLVYKKILVISDNDSLVQAFDEIVRKKELGNTFFSYKHSPSSKRGLLHSITRSEHLEQDVINLKDDTIVIQVIEEFDLVFSVHCKQLFPERLYKNIKCLNIHPGYNPLNRGWYPQVFAIIYKYGLGATIHEINGELDNGPIIVREKVLLYDWDTSLSAYNRVVEKEVELLEKYLLPILQNQYSTLSANDVVEEEEHLFTKKDFNKLLEIDLDEKATFRDLINRLRALSHGEYKNAYFLSDDGRKVFLNISLEVTNP